MGKRCLKCGYIAPEGPAGYEIECPKCGAVYAKVEAAATPPTEGAAPSNPPNYRKPQSIVDEERKAAEAERRTAAAAAVEQFPSPSSGFGVLVLALVMILCAVLGLATAAVGTSAIHQIILTAVYFLMFTLCVGAIAIIMAIARATASIRAEIRVAAAKAA